MQACGDVDASEFDRPTVTVSAEIPVRPDQLFAVLEDAAAWPRWLTSIQKVTWTSPEPKGIGTTRTVEIGNAFVVNEEFIAWETNERMAFRFTDCSRPVFRQFAEDYRIIGTDKGCRLTWSVLARPRAVPESVLKLARPVLALTLRRHLKRLREYVTVRYGR
jgi:ribosome-associated toxin RatA of RatAB toxin-antitoxin module